MATQLVEPNLTVSGQAGYCLLLQYEVWGTPRPYDYAEQSWNNASFKHPGEQPPSDVSVPVYWTYYDAAANIEYGHIAASIPGRGIFSSPFETETGVEWFPNIQSVTDRINRIPNANSRYLGWTEDFAGVKLIEGENDMVPTVDLLNALFMAFLGRPSTPEEQTEFVNKITYNDLIPILNDNNAERNALVAVIDEGKSAPGQIADLENQVKTLTDQINTPLPATTNGTNIDMTVKPKPLPQLEPLPIPMPHQPLLEKIWSIIWG